LNYIKIYIKINLKKEKKLKIKIFFLKNTIYIYILTEYNCKEEERTVVEEKRGTNQIMEACRGDQWDCKRIMLGFRPSTTRAPAFSTRWIRIVFKKEFSTKKRILIFLVWWFAEFT
jgi:hypothetical protein